MTMTNNENHVRREELLADRRKLLYGMHLLVSQGATKKTLVAMALIEKEIESLDAEIVELDLADNKKPSET